MFSLAPRSVIKPMTQAEASYLVKAVATYYPDITKVYIPNEPYYKLKPGLELTQPRPVSNNPPVDDMERSLRRTKKTVRDYVLTNRFELFVSFTFKDNRQDPDHCKRRMQNWLKNQNKRVGKFNYLIVPEFHKDKISLHFHALLSGYNGKIEVAINPKTGLPVRRGEDLFYVLPSYTLGFSNAQIVNYADSGHLKLAHYVAKYITKEMPLFVHKNRYWVSRGLKLPPTEDNPAEWYKTATPTHVIKVDHGEIRYFNNDDIKEAGHVLA